MTETPASTLKSRMLAMAREAARLTAATQEAERKVRGALARYAAGLIELPEVQEVQAEHRRALDAEQAHGAALDVAQAELEALAVESERAALVLELDTAREKLALIEGDATARLEAAEREYREALYAARQAQGTAHTIRAQAQRAGFRLLALRGEALDTTQAVPTPQQREEMLVRLEPWRVRFEQAAQFPPDLAALPRNPADSDSQHARRWPSR